MARPARRALLAFPDTLAQGKAFGRIVLFIERADAPKTRLMTAAEVGPWLQRKHEQIATLTAGAGLSPMDWRSSLPLSSRSTA